jgi:hypothetical protein
MSNPKRGEKNSSVVVIPLLSLSPTSAGWYIYHDSIGG